MTHVPLQPPRLVDSAHSAFERELLRTAQADTASQESRTRVALALGVGSGSNGALPDSSLAASSDSLGVTLTQWVVGIAGVAALGVAFQTTQPISPPQPSPEPSGEILKVQTPAQPIPPPIVAPKFEPRASVKPPSSRAQRTKASKPRPPEKPSYRLIDEVHALDSVRSLLRADQLKNAWRELKRYRARFGEGKLTLEADILEVNLALSQGNRSDAEELANTLLHRPEAARYRSRLERLLKHRKGIGWQNLSQSTDRRAKP